MRVHRNDTGDVQTSSDFYYENLGSDSDDEYHNNRVGNQLVSNINGDTEPQSLTNGNENKRQILTHKNYQDGSDIELQNLLPREREPDHSSKIIIIVLVIVLLVTLISLIVALTTIGTQKTQPVTGTNCSEPPPVVSDSTVTRTGVYSIYTCHQDFYPIGESTIVCQDGAWSPVKFKCSRYCGSPPNIRYSTHQSSGNIAGAVTSYFCLSGYVPVGGTNIMCNTNGQWSPSDLSCLKDCGRPPDQPSSNNVYTTSYMGSKVIYYCYSGYSMVGNPVVTCQSDGQWSANNFNCVDPNRGRSDKQTKRNLAFELVTCTLIIYLI